VELDNTRITIRERGLLDTLDLSLHVLREFVQPVFWFTLAAVIHRDFGASTSAVRL